MNTFPKKSVRIPIFAKAPLSGVAKTRLIPALGAEGSSCLAAKLIEHTVVQAVLADTGPLELWVSPTRILRTAANRLDHHDALLVPVSDGGYALLGLRRYLPAVFSDMPWSTSGVASMTRQRIRDAGWKLKQLASLHDIDEPQDLQHLPTAWTQCRVSRPVSGENYTHVLPCKR